MPRTTHETNPHFQPALLTHPVTGKTQTRAQWAKHLKIKLPALQKRLYRDRLGLSKRPWWKKCLPGPPTKKSKAQAKAINQVTSQATKTNDIL